jgi:spermidine synthase
MACTLRACLDVLPARARLVVVELNDVVVRWCREGPLAELDGSRGARPRVRLRVGDVADVIREAASPGADRFDAVILDLYEGPHPVCPRDHPHYGQQALDRAHAALRERGVFALWSEDPNPSFEKHLTRAGFTVRSNRPPHGTRRHVVYLGERGLSRASLFRQVVDSAERAAQCVLEPAPQSLGTVPFSIAQVRLVG